MRFSLLVALLVGQLAVAPAATAAPQLGQKLKPVELQGESGGRVDGSAWSSEMLKGKVWAFFYVDPDHRDENESLKEALQKEGFPKDKYSSTAVINMDASWLPNTIIGSSLKSNQEKYPDVVYVKDMNKVLVKEWGFDDDAYVVALFDKQGQLLMYRTGDFDQAATAAMIRMIKEHLDD